MTFEALGSSHDSHRTDVERDCRSGVQPSEAVLQSLFHPCRQSARGDRDRMSQRATHVAAVTEVALKNRPVRRVDAPLREIGVDFDFVMLEREQYAGYRPPAVSTCIRACIFWRATASRGNKSAAHRFRRRSHGFNSSAGADRWGRAGSQSHCGRSRNSFPP